MADSKINILLLTTSIGSGHVKVAHALREAFENTGEVAAVRILDIFDLLPGWFRSTFMVVYLWLLRKFPWVYATLYAFGDQYPVLLRGRSLIGVVLSNKLARDFSRLRPDAVICTHATPAGMMARLHQDGQYTGKMYGVITDFAVHRWWVYPEIHSYFVAASDMGDDFDRAGCSREKAKITGIPVQQEFSAITDINRKDSIYKRFGLHPGRPVVLIMGGGTGILPVEELLRRLLRDHGQLQYMVVTGSNKKLAKRLRQLAQAETVSVIVFDYVEFIPELMAVATVLVTKPGGVTCAEALSCKLPMILFSPLPGVEQKNSDFLALHRAAFIAVDAVGVSSALSCLLADAGIDGGNSSSAMALFAPDAADRVVRHVMLDLRGV